MMTTIKRRVEIKPIERNGKVLAYAVRYCQRRKGQRYYAAQFENLSNLRTWLADQSDLELVESNAGYYVLGQTGESGLLIRCTDKGAMEAEFAAMHMSSCKRIARTIRPVTEDKAESWFESVTRITKRDSRFNHVLSQLDEREG